MNQQGVVKNEVRVNVLNQPYGGFPWLDLPQVANKNWYNAHNFYGDLADLDAATLEDAQAFFDTYYAPEQRGAGDRRRFRRRRSAAPGSRSTSAPFRRAAAAERPDLTEPRQEREKRASLRDRARAASGARARLSRAAALHARACTRSACSTRSCCQGEDIAAVATAGAAARLYRAACPAASTCSATCSTTTARCCGCLAWSTTRRQAGDAIVADVDAEIERLQAATPVDRRNSHRARTQDRARRCTTSTVPARASGCSTCSPRFALFDNDPARINRIEAEFARGDAGADQQTAREYLRPTNRTDPDRRAGQAAAAQELRHESAIAALPRCCSLLRDAASRTRARRRRRPGTPRDFRVPAKRDLRAAERPDGHVHATTAACRRSPCSRSCAPATSTRGRDTWLADVTGEMLKEGTHDEAPPSDIARQAARHGRHAERRRRAPSRPRSASRCCPSTRRRR